MFRSHEWPGRDDQEKRNAAGQQPKHAHSFHLRKSDRGGGIFSHAHHDSVDTNDTRIRSGVTARRRDAAIHLSPFINERFEGLRSQLKSRRTLAIAFSMLSVIVVFMVAVVLHRRALAQLHEVRILDCPIVSGVGHYHDESCFDESGNLVCPLDEVELHYHDEGCYDEEGNLVCNLAEGGETHQHGPGCFQTVLVDNDGNVVDGATETSIVQESEPAKVHFEADLREPDGDGHERVIVKVQADAPADALPEDAKLYVDRLREEKVDDDQASDPVELEPEAVELNAAEDDAATEDKDKTDESQPTLVEDASEKAIEKVEDKAPGKVADVLALDLSFRDGEGKRVESTTPLTVRVTSDIIADDSDPYVVRFNDKGEASLVKPLDAGELATRQIEDKSDELVFDTDKLVPCAVAIASTDQTLEAGGGESYENLRVDAPASAGVPRGSELRVSEIGEGAEGYDDLVQQARETLGEGAGSILLYDISIARGNDEIQPQDAVDVNVTLTPDVAERFGDVSVMHFGANGPELIDAHKDGQNVDFAATGFSVYAIVDMGEPYVPEEETVASLEDLVPAQGASASGPYLLRLTYGGSDKYCTSSLNNNNAFIEGSIANAAEWYFEPTGTANEYKIYTVINGTNQYIQNTSGNLVGLTTAGSATKFTIENADNGKYTIRKSGAQLWLQHSNGGGGIRFYTSKSDAPNTRFTFVYADSLEVPDDPYGLDGAAYGIAYHEGRQSAVGLDDAASGANKLATHELTVRQDLTDQGRFLLASGDDDLVEWNFVCQGGDVYHITATTDEGTMKYLSISSAGVKLVDTPDAGSNIQVIPGTGDHAGTCSLYAQSRYLSLGDNVFTVSSTRTDQTYLNLVSKIDDLDDDDYTQYKARKVNLSDREQVPDGAHVVLYTRVWDDTEKRYQYYVVDHDGTLKRVHESGDTIQWIGGSVNTVTWEFTEYTDSNGDPTYYYELQNDYSHQYIAPQLNGQLLQADPIGLNINGRRYESDSSAIVAWDDPYYDFAGLCVNMDDGKVETAPFAQADDFYFAIIDPVDPEAPDQLTTVDTVDHTQYGISMRMVDYNNAIVSGSPQMDAVQREILGSATVHTGNDSTLPVTGMLQPYLSDNGYPMTNPAVTETGGDPVSLGLLYRDYTGVGDKQDNANHLFLKSTYNESGYFEYDSTQNFAHLNDDGTFTVYDQVAGIGTRSGPTRTHGQFAPYNDIYPGVFSTLRNLTHVDQTPLDDSDPRKGEKLYLVPDKKTGDIKAVDYYYGMELSASFTQTPSGLDAWGHDIIFEFSGDDDFWLYVDGYLVIDLGGIRSAASGSINFRTGEINNHTADTIYEAFEQGYRAQHPDATDEEVQAWLDSQFEVNAAGQHVFKSYTNHTMKMFYMERGAGASNLHMRFNLAAAKPNTVVLTKEIDGTESADYALAEFPYQVYCKDPGSTAENPTYTLLPQKQIVNGKEVSSVTYTDRTVPVKFAQSYTPTGGTTAYDNVFFLKPGQSADIRLPDGVTEYYIKECGVSTSIYDQVSANGATLQGESSPNAGRNDYATDTASLADRPRVSYVNHVNPNALRTLSITKRLYDEQGNEITDDPTGFTMRLSLANEDGTPELANMTPYSVKDPSGVYCIWDKDQGFVPLPSGKTSWGDLTDEEKAAVTFRTSIYGAISKIPAPYTVEVRDLIVGTKFMVEEYERDLPSGYGFKEYARVDGSYIVEPGEGPNEGTIRDNSDPQVEVHNVRGWGLTANKVWSDNDFMEGHDPIYFAIYVKGQLLDGSVRQLAYGDTSAYWFFLHLENGATIDDYEVREVVLEGSFDPAQQVDAEGNVTIDAGTTVTPIDGGGTLQVQATPTGESPATYTYDVSYAPGTATGAVAGVNNVRTDTVLNTRDGIKIYKEDLDGHRLPGAVFRITDANDASVGADSYTSDDDGYVTSAYLADGVYHLSETSVPTGYRALEGQITITTGGGNVTLSGVDADQGLYDYNSETKTITIKNRGFALRARKVGPDKSTGLAGAHFALYRETADVSGNPRPDYSPMAGYTDLVSGQDGTIPGIDETLAPGGYYLKETAAPEGYRKFADDFFMHFTVSGTGVVTLTEDATLSLVTERTDEGNVVSTMLIANNPASLKVDLRKVDEGGGDLAGATFELLKWEGAGAPDSASGSWVHVQDNIKPGDDSDPSNPVPNPVRLGSDPLGLEVGAYRLRETGMPDGYVSYNPNTDFFVELSSQTHTLVARLADASGEATCEAGTDQDDTVLYTITIPNTPGTELPHSGGMGTVLFYAVGSVLAAAGALHLARQRQLER